jgi:integrase
MPSLVNLHGVPVSVFRPTFEQYAIEWLERRRLARKLDWKHQERRLRLHAFPEIGLVPLESMTRAMMLGYARSLAGRHRVDGSRGLSSRTVKNIADSVKSVFTDAVEDGLIGSNPCVWNARKHLPANRDVDPLRRVNGFFTVEEVRALVRASTIAPARRMAYAIEFLTGMRPGEVAALRVGDVDLAFPPAGRVVVARAWSSDNRIEGTTKTKVTKVVPIHPALGKMLKGWLDHGFQNAFGRAPTPGDLVVAAPRGGHRMASQTNREFQADLARLGLRRRVHSDTRATFRALVIAARPDLERFADLVTHPSPKEAKDLYRRIDSLWPRMCEAVAAIDVGGTRSVSQERSRTKARRRIVHTRRQSVSALSRRELRTTISGALRSLSAGRVDLAAEALRTLERRMV